MGAGDEGSQVIQRRHAGPLGLIGISGVALEVGDLNSADSVGRVPIDLRSVPLKVGAKGCADGHNSRVGRCRRMSLKLARRFSGRCRVASVADLIERE